MTEREESGTSDSLPRRPTPAPADVSVLIGARRAAGTIRGCLRSIEAELRADRSVEVVLAVEPGDDCGRIAAEEFPWVVRVAAAAGANLAQLRAAAFAASTGRIVLFTDAHCEVLPGWIAAARGAIDAGADVAAGSVENGTPGSVADWTGYLFDYGEFHPPLAAGPATALSGNTIAYRREALGDPSAHAGDGLLKYFVNRRLAAEGARLVCVPEMAVRYRRAISVAHLARDRYHFGRCFAAQRLEREDGAFRLQYRLAAPLLPALATYRLFSRLLARPILRRRVARCALPLAVAGAAWGLGEAAGALLGRGGSCRKVY